MNLKNPQHYSAWFGLQVRPGCRMILDFWPDLQAPQAIPGQARPKKSGLLAALAEIFGIFRWGKKTVLVKFLYV
jgi:hypothetical protein